MTWLVLAMGVLLVLVGAVSVISGAPIIQIERGWAEVIAGSVAVSGGAVTFALAVILFRLQTMQQIAGRAVASARASETGASGTSGEESLSLRPTYAPSEPVHVALAEPADGDVAVPREPAAGVRDDHAPLWKAVREPSREPQPDEVRAPDATGVAATVAETADTAPSVKVGQVSERRGDEVSTHQDEDGEAAPRLSYAPAARSAPSDDRGRRSSGFARDWMSRPLLRSRGTKQAPTEPPPLFAGPPTDGDEENAPLVEPSRAGADDDLASTSKASLDAETSAEPQVEAKQEPEPAIIGRYQAGASTYTMYANGAIDVETEGGDVHRFGSMAELKAFIARQENAVS